MQMFDRKNLADKSPLISEYSQADHSTNINTNTVMSRRTNRAVRHVATKKPKFIVQRKFGNFNDTNSVYDDGVKDDMRSP